jgi:small subunit ribosomal protein S6
MRVGGRRGSVSPPPKEAQQSESAEEPRERPAHEAMLHWRRFLLRHRAVRFPSGASRRGRFRPWEGRSRETVEGRSRETVLVAYEILLMLDPELPEARQDEIIKRARQLVEQGKGNWVGHNPWGRRRLAYEIGHKGEGTYHLLNFDAEPETLEELSRILRITDGVMRHLAVRRIEGATPGPPPPEPEPLAQSVPEPAYAEANTRSEEE